MAIACTCLLAMVAPADAQQRQRPPHRADAQEHDGTQTRPDRRRGENDRPRRPPSDRPRFALMERLLSPNPFRPDPADFGPLAPGEDDELLGFARDRMPDKHRAMIELRERRPEVFREHFRRLLPRLRQMRRVFEQDEELGHKLVHHSDNMESLARVQRYLAEHPDDEAVRQRAALRIEQLEGENLRIELQVLGARLERLRDLQELLVDQFVEMTLEPEADLAGEPVAMQQIARRYHAEPGETERAQIRDRLRELCARRISERIDELQDRYESMRADAPMILEDRIRGRLEGGGRHRPFGPDGDRRLRGDHPPPDEP